MSANDELTAVELAQTVEDFAQEHRAWVRKPIRVENVGSFPGATAEIVMYERTPAEEHVRRLNVAATALKKTDIGTAVEYLRRARALNDSIGDRSHPTEWYLRLPLFLQQAGRMDESLVEFEILLANTDRYVVYPQMSALEIERSRHAYLGSVYDKLRLAWKRENNVAKSEEAQRLCDFHRGERERLEKMIEKERNARMKQYERERGGLA